MRRYVAYLGKKFLLGLQKTKAGIIFLILYMNIAHRLYGNRIHEQLLDRGKCAIIAKIIKNRVMPREGIRNKNDKKMCA